MKKDNINKKYSPDEQVDSFVFRSKRTQKQIDNDANELNVLRKQIKSEMTESQILFARLNQLRFQIEDYAKSDKYNQNYSFAYFLRKYIKLNYKIQKHFAKDIKLSDSTLSSILNKGRPPGKKIVIRLELHSNNVISAISWYKLWEKEKEYELQNDEKIRIIEKKHVLNKLILSI